MVDSAAAAITQEARELHLPQPKGVLLAGPPGTGKTLLAKNIANILNLPLLQLDIASLLGSLVGESEGNVRHALKTAEAIAYGGRLRHRTLRFMGGRDRKSAFGDW